MAGVRNIGVGLIGAGWMGRAHAMAYHNAAMVFGQRGVKADLVAVADSRRDAAQQLSDVFGFANIANDWRAVVEDARVNLVDIAAPNKLHAEIAIAAAEAGKHVYCEKPMALTVEDSARMVSKSCEHRTITMVGYNYLKNPAQRLAHSIITSGDLGEITSFRGSFDQDFMADPLVPFSWRHDRSTGGAGALGDMATHTLSLSQYLVGDVAEVCGMARTFITRRPVAATGSGHSAHAADGARCRDVENDDVVHFLLRFVNGALGEIASSRIGMGRRLGLGYEIQGTKGALCFTQERMNELQIFDASVPNNERGYRTVYIGPGHGDYEAFHPIPGIGLGYNDQKIIEAQDILEAVAKGRPAHPDFEFGHKISMTVAAVERSIAEHRWVKLAEFDRSGPCTSST